MKLYKHQEKALDLFSEREGFMLLAEQGTGKTLPTLIHMSNLVINGDARPDHLLVVSPLSAMGAWERDVEKLPKFRQQALKNLRVINYDKLSRMTSKWAKEIASQEWDVVVLDEAHAIKNRTSNRSKFFLGYNRGRKRVEGLKAKYRYVLTGTLITNGKLEDVWAPMQFIAPGVLGSYDEFSQRYLVTFRPPNASYSIVKGYVNTESLTRILSEFSYRVLKKDCLDLPEKMPDEKVMLDLLEPQMYAEAVEKYIDSLDMAFDNQLVAMMKQRQIATGFIKDDEGTTHTLKSNKPQILEELIEATLPHKTVVFCDFKHSIKQVAAVCEKLKVKYVILDGDQKDKNIWRKFQAKDDIKVFIGQIQSANSGIDLYTSTHTVYYEPPISTMLLEQSRDRTHRIGVTRACNYKFLITKGTIEEIIYNRLCDQMDFTMEFYEEVVRKVNGLPPREDEK